MRHRRPSASETRSNAGRRRRRGAGQAWPVLQQHECCSDTGTICQSRGFLASARRASGPSISRMASTAVVSSGTAGSGSRPQALSPSRGIPACGQERGVQPRRHAPRLREHDGTVKVWDAATGQEALTLKGHTGAVIERGVQPRRHAPRLRERRRYGEGVGRGDRPGGPRPQGAYRGGHERGVQPRRHAPRLRGRRRHGEGVGRGDRPGGPHPQGAYRRRSGAWRSAPTARASPPRAATAR